MLGCQTWKNDRKYGKMNDREGDEPHVWRMSCPCDHGRNEL